MAQTVYTVDPKSMYAVFRRNKDESWKFIEFVDSVEEAADKFKAGNDAGAEMCYVGLRR